MTIDLNKIKEKYEQLNKAPGSGGGNNRDIFWNPPTGKTETIRILPAKDEKDPFFSETKIHRIKKSGNDFESNVICLEVTDGRGKCPICDLYRALYKTDQEEHKVLAKKIKPRERYFLNVVLRETGDVKVFSLGSQLFKKIIGTILDADFGDITDLQEGFDFKIQKVIVEGYPNYNQSGARPKSSPAGSDQDIARYKESMHDLKQFVKPDDYSSVKTIALEAAPPELANFIGVVETSKRGSASKSDFDKLRA